MGPQADHPLTVEEAPSQCPKTPWAEGGTKRAIAPEAPDEGKQQGIVYEHSVEAGPSLGGLAGRQSEYALGERAACVAGQRQVPSQGRG